MRFALTLFLLTIVSQIAVSADITRIWLTHKTNDPSKIVVNWMTDEAGDSVVRFGLTADYGETVKIDNVTTLHHVEIPSYSAPRRSCRSWETTTERFGLVEKSHQRSQCTTWMPRPSGDSLNFPVTIGSGTFI